MCRPDWAVMSMQRRQSRIACGMPSGGKLRRRYSITVIAPALRVTRPRRGQQEPCGHCAEPHPTEMSCLHLSPPRRRVRLPSGISRMRRRLWAAAKSVSYAISAERCRCYSDCRRSVADGDSPNRAWYSTAKRPSCQKPKRVAMAVTDAASGPASRSARRVNCMRRNSR
jgi:hypothetical protein